MMSFGPEDQKMCVFALSSAVCFSGGHFDVQDSYLHAFILAHDSSQLQVTFDLLPDLLEAVHNGNRRDGVDPTQNVQRHVHQPLKNQQDTKRSKPQTTKVETQRDSPELRGQKQLILNPDQLTTSTIYSMNLQVAQQLEAVIIKLL